MVTEAAIVAVAIAAGLAGPMRRALGSGWLVAFGLMASVGVIGAAMLTPSYWPITSTSARPACSLGPFAAPTAEALQTVNDVSLNVALYVPFGLACAVLPRLRQVAVAAAVGLMLAPSIEVAQGVLPELSRVCSGADIADNQLGFGAGLLFGLLLLRPLLWAVERERRAGHRPLHVARPLAEYAEYTESDRPTQRLMPVGSGRVSHTFMVER